MLNENIENIFYLRTYRDANNIHNQINEDKNVVLIGSSFIGKYLTCFCC